MSDKKVFILAVFAGAAIVGAIFVSKISNRTKPAIAGQGNLIQGLDPSGIAQIIVGPSKSAKEKIILNRKDKNFTVENLNNYPASNRAINDLIATCLDIRIVDFYTEQEKNFADLGVTDDNAMEAVKFLDSGGKIITGVIVGKTREKGQMAYARPANSNKVYVINNIPSVKDMPIEYVDEELVSVDKANIENIVVSTAQNFYTLLGEANGTEIKIKELPAGKKENKNECRMVFDALGNLRFDDVKSAEEMNSLDFNRRYSCQLKDQTLYTIDIARQGEKYYAKCSADFLDKQQVVKEQGVESQEELKKKEAKLIARDNAKKFTDTCSGWIYRLPQYEGKNMTKLLAELVEDIKPADANETKDVKNPLMKSGG